MLTGLLVRNDQTRSLQHSTGGIAHRRLPIFTTPDRNGPTVRKLHYGPAFSRTAALLSQIQTGPSDAGEPFDYATPLIYSTGFNYRSRGISYKTPGLSSWLSSILSATPAMSATPATATGSKRPLSDSTTTNTDNGDHRKRRRNRTTQSCMNCHTSKRMVLTPTTWPPSRASSLNHSTPQCDRKRPCGRCTQLGLVSPISAKRPFLVGLIPVFIDRPLRLPSRRGEPKHRK